MKLKYTMMIQWSDEDHLYLVHLPEYAMACGIPAKAVGSKDVGPAAQDCYVTRTMRIRKTTQDF